jgi:hypothetical protein
MGGKGRISSETVETLACERLTKNVHMQGFRIPRNEAYREVRRSEEG